MARITAIVLAALALAACSSSGGSKSSSSTATSSTPASTTEAPSPSTTVDVSSLKAQAQAALLVASDLGPNFTAGTYTPKDPKQPEPCGQQSVDSRFPPLFTVGTELDQGQDLSFSEEVAAYADEATTTQALAAGEAGLSCTTGTFYGAGGQSTTAQLSGPTDVTSQVGGQKAEQWTAKGDGFQAVLIAVEGKTSLTAMSFVAASQTAAQSAPDPVAVAKKAIDKLING